MTQWRNVFVRLSLVRARPPTQPVRPALLHVLGVAPRPEARVPGV